MSGSGSGILNEATANLALGDESCGTPADIYAPYFASMEHIANTCTRLLRHLKSLDSAAGRPAAYGTLPIAPDSTLLMATENCDELSWRHYEMPVGKVSPVSRDQEVRNAGDGYLVEWQIIRVAQLLWYRRSSHKVSVVLEELEY